MFKETFLLQPELQKKVKWEIVAAVTAVLLILAGAWLFYSGTFNALVNQPPTITQDELENITGVRVSLIAVTAGGGFIDFRVKVVDADKATQFFADPDRLPVLVAEGSDANLTLEAAEEYEADFEADRVYYLLYANQQNSIRQGTPVTVVIGDIYLEPIVAK